MDTPIKILFIEDSETDHHLLLRYFSQKSDFKVELYRIETQQEFESAFEQPWDAIISDYNVPGFSALSALQIMKSRGVDTPLLVVSGDVGEETAVEMMRAGADDFIRKDNLSRLIPALQRSIQTHQSMKHKAKLRLAHEQALRERERLMDVVCHDLKNPLSSIKISCQLILAETKTGKTIDPSWLTDITDRMLRSTERIARLIQDLLEQSKIESGIFSIYPKNVNIADFLKEVLLVHIPLAEAKHIEIILEEISPTMTGFIDKDRCFQVLGNLLSNAIKFSPPNSKVFVNVETTPEGTTFSVKDSGSGILEQEKPLVFSKHYQGKDHKFKGHGLGLWIASEIVRAHNGNISFDSNPGEGTRFCFFLPNSKTVAPHALSEGNPTKGKVLIVDDDEDLSEALCKVITAESIPCVITDHFEGAIKILEEQSWDANDTLLIDYDLPGKNGGELIEWIKNKYLETSLPKIILMSAHPDVYERVKRLNISHFLKKPMNIQDIFDLLLIPAKSYPSF